MAAPPGDGRPASDDPSLDLGGYVFDKKEAGTVSERRERELGKFAEPSMLPRLHAQGGEPFYRPRRVLVVADPRTFSAAADFLYFLKEMGGELVGVPPMQSPNAFMDLTPFELSRSKLKGAISHNAQMYMPEAPEATTFKFDHPMTTALFAKFGFDEDAPVRYALSLLGEAKEKGER